MASSPEPQPVSLPRPAPYWRWYGGLHWWVPCWGQWHSLSSPVPCWGWQFLSEKLPYEAKYLAFRAMLLCYQVTRGFVWTLCSYWLELQGNLCHESSLHNEHSSSQGYGTHFCIVLCFARLLFTLQLVYCFDTCPVFYIVSGCSRNVVSSDFSLLPGLNVSLSLFYPIFAHISALCFCHGYQVWWSLDLCFTFLECLLLVLSWKTVHLHLHTIPSLCYNSNTGVSFKYCVCFACQVFVFCMSLI